jgi:hypothetical protein
MKRYEVILKQTANASIFLNAENKNDAKEKAVDILEDLRAETFIDPDSIEEITNDYWDIDRVELA